MRATDVKCFYSTFELVQRNEMMRINNSIYVTTTKQCERAKLFMLSHIATKRWDSSGMA